MRSIKYLLEAYFTTTLFAMLLSIIIGYILELPGYWEIGVKPSQSPAYKSTEPFQPLLCLLCYGFFAYRRLQPASVHPLQLCLVGLIGSILIDWLLFVAIPHPFSFSYSEFYIGYQPWISIVYLTIAFTPISISKALFIIKNR